MVQVRDGLTLIASTSRKDLNKRSSGSKFVKVDNIYKDCKCASSQNTSFEPDEQMKSHIRACQNNKNGLPETLKVILMGLKPQWKFRWFCFHAVAIPPSWISSIKDKCKWFILKINNIVLYFVIVHDSGEEKLHLVNQMFNKATEISYLKRTGKWRIHEIISFPPENYYYWNWLHCTYYCVLLGTPRIGTAYMNHRICSI